MLRLAHGTVNAMDLELCQARRAAVAGAGRRPGAGRGAHRDRPRLLGRRRPAPLPGRGAPYVERFLPALAELFRAAFELAKPLVAAVNGHAIAGGCVLAACADVTLMAEGNGPDRRARAPGRGAVPADRDRGAPARGRRRRGPPAGGGRTPTRRPPPGRSGWWTRWSRPTSCWPGGAAARELATEIPADTFAPTKAQLRRDARERIDRDADEAEPVTSCGAAAPPTAGPRPTSTRSPGSERAPNVGHQVAGQVPASGGPPGWRGPAGRARGRRCRRAGCGGEPRRRRSRAGEQLGQVVEPPPGDPGQHGRHQRVVGAGLQGELHGAQRRSRPAIAPVSRACSRLYGLRRGLDLRDDVLGVGALPALQRRLQQRVPPAEVPVEAALGGRRAGRERLDGHRGDPARGERGQRRRGPVRCRKTLPVGIAIRYRMVSIRYRTEAVMGACARTGGGGPGGRRRTPAGPDRRPRRCPLARAGVGADGAGPPGGPRRARAVMDRSATA